MGGYGQEILDPREFINSLMFQICFLSASLGLTDDQREFQRVALEFAKNELAPEMQKWDQEVCEKKGF